MKKILLYLNNLWYNVFRIDKIFGVNKGSESMNIRRKEKVGILSAKDLACYIKHKYNEEYEKNITPIKMQKSLYFCFAFWAGFVNKGKIDGTLPASANEVLFDEEFEAWAYGHVVPKVYFNEKKLAIFPSPDEEIKALERVDLIFAENQFLNETIDSLLEDIFAVSDFKLVSLSHSDKSWQNHFKSYEKKHNEKIPHKEIIDEYTAKNFD